MSIIAYAIRTCLGAALDGRTIAGGRVFDSAVQPIDEMVAKDGAEPFIVISTDDEKFEPKGWAALDAPRTINIVIEAAVGGITRVTLPDNKGGGEELRLDIPHTDEGLETSLNMLGRQIWREIQIGGPWSDLLRNIAFWPKEISITRGANTEQGIRYAARQYVIQADTIAEPDFGAEPEGLIADLLDMMRADPRLEGDVPLLEGMIVGEPLPEWRRRQADLGLTNASFHALGLAPYFAGGSEAVFQQVAIRRPGRETVFEAGPTP